jgi:lipid-A-disaccharide synthase
MRELARNTDKLAVVLPFEERLFEEAGATVTFVGHPLLDLPASQTTREQFCAENNIDASKQILALLPGSRLQEVRSHGQLFSDAARLVQQKLPSVQPVVAQAPGISDDDLRQVPWPTVRNSAELLRFARSALTKSGTSTLECALALVPMVIAYRMNPLTFLIAQQMVQVEHIGLVNLIAGRRAAPEFVQEQATPQALAEQLVAVTADGPTRDVLLRELHTVRQRLVGDPRGAAARVGDLAQELLMAK